MSTAPLPYAQSPQGLPDKQAVGMRTAVHPGLVAHPHQAPNVRVWLDEAGRARSNTCRDTTMSRAQANGTLVDTRLPGRYVDQRARRENASRIADRHLLRNVDQSDPQNGPPFAARDRADPL